MRQSFPMRGASNHLSFIGLTALVWGCQQRPAADGVAAAPATVPEKSAGAPSAGAPSNGGTTRLSASESARLDSVMTPDRVFPSAAQRAAYRARPAEVKDGTRSYTFELSPQPGMVPEQHFHSITFTFAPAGTMLKQPGSEPEIMSAGGPQGSFVRASARSADGAYDVSVMERMLLPSTLPRPEIRADTALAAVLERLQNESAP